MKYTKSSITTGAWVDKSTLKNGQRAKIVSETKPIPSNFKSEDGSIQTQDVAKIRFEGIEDAVNTSLNKTTTNGLMDAFGDDSINWQGKNLTVYVEKGRYGGKASYSLYLIPEGYVMQDDENGYAQIVPSGTPKIKPGSTQTLPDDPEIGGHIEDVNDESRVKPEDIPF